MGRRSVRIVAHKAEIMSALPYHAIIRPVSPYAASQMEVQGFLLESTGHHRRGTWMFGKGGKTNYYLPPPCFPGGVIYLAEEWATEQRFDGCAPSAIPSSKNPAIWRCDSVWYHNGDSPDDPGRWRQARHMPDWASRKRMRVGEVGVRRLLEITEADLLDYGIPRDIGQFLSDWEAHYNGSLYATTKNPLCWVMIEEHDDDEQ